MARRSDHTPEALRALVVEAADAILTRDGLAGLTARELGRRIGYSPGTIYNLFENLDEVVLHVEARVLDDLAAALDRVRQGGDAARHVQRLCAAYLDFVEASPRRWAVLFEHRLPAGQAAPAWHRARIEGLMGRLEHALAPLLAEAGPKRRARAARTLWASVHGISSLAVADKLSSVAAEDARALSRDLVETYLAGLAAGRPEGPGSGRR